MLDILSCSRSELCLGRQARWHYLCIFLFFSFFLLQEDDDEKIWDQNSKAYKVTLMGHDGPVTGLFHRGEEVWSVGGDTLCVSFFLSSFLLTPSILLLFFLLVRSSVIYHL